MKWDYEVLSLSPSEIHDETQLPNFLRELGKGGWELITIIPESPPYYARAIFKRPNPID